MQFTKYGYTYRVVETTATRLQKEGYVSYTLTVKTSHSACVHVAFACYSLA